MSTVPYHTHTFTIPTATPAEVAAGTRDDVAITPASQGPLLGMQASVYDPQGIHGDAFARANHTGAQLAATISDFASTSNGLITTALTPYSTTAQVAAGYQPLNSNLSTISGLVSSNDDILQRKAGAWTNRTPAQVKADLVLVKGDVGLGNVDNTSDATKNAATATLTNKTYDTAGTGNSFLINGVAVTANTGTGAVARAASPTFTGTPTTPTAAVDTNTTQIASTAMVLAQAAAATPLGNAATAVVGTSTRFARADHVHPGREVLTANRTYFVLTTGSDSNTGLVNTAGGAFLTLQKAINVVTDTLDLAGFTVTVQVGAGTYAAGILMTRPAMGGTLKVTGDTTTPANVVLSMAGICVSVQGAGVKLSIEGLKVISSANIGIEGIYGGQLTVTGKMDFGACSLAHIHASYAGFVDVSGVAYNITGVAIYHYFTETFGASIRAIGSVTVTITGSPAFTTFAQSVIGSGIVSVNMTFSGAVTGKRYNADTNAAIYTAGSGASYFPGSVAGTTATGGQYA